MSVTSFKYEALAELARNLAKKGEHGDACDAWRIMTKLAPDYAEAWIGAARSALALKNFDRADEICKEGFSKGHAARQELLKAYADSALHRKNWREAFGRWNTLIEKFPEYGRGYAGAAAAALELKDYGNAEVLSKKGYDIWPDKLEIVVLAAQACTRNKNLDNALQFWDILARHQKYVALLAEGAQSCLEAGRIEKAQEYCLQCLRKDYRQINKFMPILRIMISKVETAPFVLKLICDNEGHLLDHNINQSIALLNNSRNALKKIDLASLKNIASNVLDYVTLLAIRAKLLIRVNITRRLVRFLLNRKKGDCLIYLLAATMVDTPRLPKEAEYLCNKLIKENIEQNKTITNYAFTILLSSYINNEENHKFVNSFEKYKNFLDVVPTYRITRQFAYFQSIYFMIKFKPSLAINNIISNCLDYRSYDISHIVTLLTEIIKLISSKALLYSYFYRFLDDIENDNLSASLFILLSIGAYADINIVDLEKRFIDLIINCVSKQSEINDHNVLGNLTRLFNSFVSRFPITQAKSIYKSINKPLFSDSPYFLKENIYPKVDKSKKI